MVGLIDQLKNLKIKHKICLGYGLAIATAVGGSLLSSEIGDYALWQAWQQEEHARQETELLYRLQNNILYVRAEQQAMLTLVDQPLQLQQHYERLKIVNPDLIQSWQALASFTAKQEVIDETHRIHVEQLPHFLEQYRGKSQTYLDELNTIVTQYLADPSQPRSIRQLIAFNHHPLSLTLDKISDELRPLIELSNLDYQQALQEYDQADVLRLKLSLTGIILSVLLAILLALLTSRIIAQPLQTLDQIAQAVTREANFKLTVPVESQDETGRLALSLNQLIERVQTLLTEREVVNAQLHQKNQTLETTLVTLKQTQAQMIQTEKMSGLGQMVAGVAHEINNPINFIYGNLSCVNEYIEALLALLDLYQQHHPQPSVDIKMAIEQIDLPFLKQDIIDLLASMKTGSERIQNIVQSLRTFSRLDEANLKTVDLHAGLDSTLNLLNHRLQAKADQPEIQIIKRYGHLPAVECYAGKLNQVFMNLLVNAIDALRGARDRGCPSIAEGYYHPYIMVETNTNDDQIVICVSDNGSGIAEEIQTRIFEPFFTTKPIGQGTGLDLAISYQVVVEQHGGQLLCQSSPTGSKFTIQIPRYQPPGTIRLANNLLETTHIPEKTVSR